MGGWRREVRGGEEREGQPCTQDLESFFQPSKSLQAKRAHRSDDVYWVGGEGGREGLELKLIELNVHQS